MALERGVLALGLTMFVACAEGSHQEPVSRPPPDAGQRPDLAWLAVQSDAMTPVAPDVPPMAADGGTRDTTPQDVAGSADAGHGGVSWGATPWLKVQGNTIRDPGGRSVRLAGFAICDTSWVDAPAYIARLSDGTKGWHANLVRLPVHPSAWNAAYFDKHLLPAVNAARERGLYAIVDWHQITNYTTASVKEATTAFWSFVAPRLKDHSNVLFEVFNEPTQPDDWETWKSAAQAWVDLIRKSAPRNIILIGAPHYSQHGAGATTSPLSGENLAYVAHIYPRGDYPGGWDTQFAVAKSHPLFITEWGYGGPNETAGTRAGFGVPLRTWADRVGAHHTAWVASDSCFPKMFSNAALDLTDFGMFAKDWVAALNAARP